MSDGLDDPIPANSKETFNLKKIAEQYSGNDWWIYIVNLAEMQKSKGNFCSPTGIKGGTVKG